VPSAVSRSTTSGTPSWYHPTRSPASPVGQVNDLPLPIAPCRNCLRAHDTLHGTVMPEGRAGSSLRMAKKAGCVSLHLPYVLIAARTSVVLVNHLRPLRGDRNFYTLSTGCASPGCARRRSTRGYRPRPLPGPSESVAILIHVSAFLVAVGGAGAPHPGQRPEVLPWRS
jgi:hypothetical protein